MSLAWIKDFFEARTKRISTTPCPNCGQMMRDAVGFGLCCSNKSCFVMDKDDAWTLVNGRPSKK